LGEGKEVGKYREYIMGNVYKILIYKSGLKAVASLYALLGRVEVSL
jgi:hypothetical protein